MINLDEIIDKVRREDFLPLAFLDDVKNNEGYKDTQIPIGYHQNATKPSVVKHMLSLLLDGCASFNSVLEIGTGCGYQTALLAQCFNTVYTIEFFPALSKRAQQVLTEYKNIKFLIGDGRAGVQKGIFLDGIIAGTCFPSVPSSLLNQLSPKKGCLVIPVGDASQQSLQRSIKQGDTITHENCGSCGFVLAQ